MIPVTPRLALDERDLEERFIRAAGPGGQNVNKVSTAVELRFRLGSEQPMGVRDDADPHGRFARNRPRRCQAESSS